jgi:hypothetical protein
MRVLALLTRCRGGRCHAASEMRCLRRIERILRLALLAPEIV